ncbi:hypothetical protein BJX64DRAFT_285010 [Aspergillus heterothallicus]
MSPLSIKTTGHARQTRTPERALLRFIVKDSGAKPATVATSVQATTARVQSIFSSLTSPPRSQAPSKSSTLSGTSPASGDNNNNNNDNDNPGPILRYTMGPPTSYTFARTESMSKMSKHVATSVAFAVEFADFEALGAVAAQLSSVDYVYPLGVEWMLTEATKEVFAEETRAAACADALRRARSYARGFGRGEAGTSSRVEAVEVVEVGGGPGSKEGGDLGGFRVLDVLDRGHRSSFGSGDVGWSFQPAEIEFRVELSVKFVVE